MGSQELWVRSCWKISMEAFGKYRFLIIKVHGGLNTKNDVIYSHSIDEAGDLLDNIKEKFSVGEMIFGGVSVRGLIPSDRPIFTSEFLERYEPRPKTINADRYADLIRDVMGDAVKEVYPANSCLWLDDPATIHRAAVSVEAVKDTFRKRVPHEIQAPKMADCWPIENVWSIIKDKVSEDDPQTKPQLKRSIIKS